LNLLLDTHILLWWLEKNPRLSRRQQAALRTVGPDNPASISDISLWEIANLTSLGRFKPKIPLASLLEKAVAAPLARRVSITPKIAAEVANLPDGFHRDPADRILVATARSLELILVTQDRKILDSGLVQTLA
jgi:PIN domain nuclease of toxin-antitoxin system